MIEGDFIEMIESDDGDSVISRKMVIDLFRLQSPMAKRIMAKLISRVPLSKWTEGGAVKILERWTSLAASYQEQLFIAKIRAKGLPVYETMERAAILEYDAGLPRWKAEAMALEECAHIGACICGEVAK